MTADENRDVPVTPSVTIAEKSRLDGPGETSILSCLPAR
jgi:hypothetical protein